LISDGFWRTAFHVVVIIPEADDWLGQVMLIAECTEAGRVKQKIPAPDSRTEA
jgi:hypothetical protein